jgi:2-polyprenyl-3-methyl-5-hydroxy-6-metoxy-1,4-benzoquinol methylase
MKTADLILEWLSIRLPLASGNVHSNMLKRYLRGDIKTVLDVGCGRGVFPAYSQAVSTGVDIYADSLERAIHYGNYQTLKQMDVTKLDFPDKSFDAVTSIEVIEHLNKEDGLRM